MNSLNEIKNKINSLEPLISECGEVIKLNSEHYEQKITYIGFGVITATLVFAEKNQEYTWLLIAGLIVLLFSCMMNLYSYIWYTKLLRDDYNEFYEIQCGLLYLEDSNTSKEYYEKHKIIIEKSYSDFNKYIAQKIDIRISKADTYNLYNLCILFIGLIIILLYIILNLNFHVKERVQENDIKIECKIQQEQVKL